MRTRIMRLSFAALLSAFFFAAMVSVTTTSSVQAATHAPNVLLLGNLNLQAYCQSLGYGGVTTVGNTGYDWRCVTSSGSQVLINMGNACQWQYGLDNIIDRFTDFYTITSVQCWH